MAHITYVIAGTDCSYLSRHCCDCQYFHYYTPKHRRETDCALWIIRKCSTGSYFYFPIQAVVHVAIPLVTRWIKSFTDVAKITCCVVASPNSSIFLIQSTVKHFNFYLPRYDMVFQQKLINIWEQRQLQIVPVLTILYMISFRCQEEEAMCLVFLFGWQKWDDSLCLHCRVN